MDLYKKIIQNKNIQELESFIEKIKNDENFPKEIYMQALSNLLKWKNEKKNKPKSDKQEETELNYVMKDIVSSETKLSNMVPINFHPKISKLFNTIKISSVIVGKEKDEKSRNPYMEQVINHIHSILTDKVKKKIIGFFFKKQEVERSLMDIFDIIRSIKKSKLMDEFWTLSTIYTKPHLTIVQIEKMCLRFLLQKKILALCIKELTLDKHQLSACYHENSLMMIEDHQESLIELIVIVEDSMSCNFDLPSSLKREKSALMNQLEECSQRIINCFEEKKNTIIFNVDLKVILKRENENGFIPNIIQKLFEEIRRRGFEEKGMFRFSGKKSEVDFLIEAIDKGEEVDFSKVDSIHTLCDLLKEYYRRIPGTLCTYELLKKFLTISEIWEDERVFFLKELLEKLDLPNKALLNEALSLLKDVSKMSKMNNMNEKNLALIWGLNFISPKTKNPLKVLQITSQINGLAVTFIQEYEKIKNIIDVKEKHSIKDYKKELKITQKDEFGVLKRIGNESNNKHMGEIIRDYFIQSLVLILSEGLQDTFFKYVYLWEVFEYLVVNNDHILGGSVSLKLLIQKMNDIVKVSFSKKIESNLKCVTLICFLLNQELLEDFLRLFFVKEDIINKYYSNALIMNRKEKSKILSLVKRITKYPLKIKITKIGL